MGGYKVYPDIKFYFLTSTIVEWIPVFIDREFFSIITDSLSYCANNKDLRIYGYVVMPNHIHLLVSSNNLSDVMRDFKSYTSNEISDLVKEKDLSVPEEVFRNAAEIDRKSENYKVWQSGFHPKGIESESFYKQKLNYIHENPVKKGFVTKPQHWFHSSARNYAGMDSYPLEIEIL